MSPSQHDGPAGPDPTGPARPGDLWGDDELDALLADSGGAGRLGQVLAAAAAPGEADPVAGEEAARNAFREAFPVLAARKSRRLSRVSGRAAAAILVGGLVVSGGAAAAAVGALPGATQQAAKDVLAKVGVSVPGPKKHAGEHPTKPGTSTQKPVTTPEPSAAPRDNQQPGTGGEVSDLARSTATTGAGKGAAVSSAASDGKSHAGEHGKPTDSPPGQTKKTKTPKPHPTKGHNGASDKPHPGPTAHTKHPDPLPHVQARRAGAADRTQAKADR